MAKVIEYREISLDDLTIGKGQVRTGEPGKDIEELMESIKVQGLLQPIVVCRSDEQGKWEILTGQRRFLAFKLLERKSIPAAILDEVVDERHAKAISITENLIRRNLSGTELIEGITFLYNRYGGSIKMVVNATGISERKVREYVKYERLLPELKEMVDEGTVNISVALKAQDAAAAGGDEVSNPQDAIVLAKEMSQMVEPQRKKLVQERKADSSLSVSDAIERAKTGGKVTQIIVTLTDATHSALQQFSKKNHATQDEAAALLIEAGLEYWGE